MTTFSRLIGRTPEETTWEPNSVVCIEARIGLGRWRNSGSFPEESKDLSFLQSFEPSSWPHQPPSQCTGLLFLADKAAGA
jgi:hypothetical protein